MHILLKSLTIVSSLIAGLHAMESDPGNPEFPNEIAGAVLTEIVKDNYIKEDFESFIEIVRSLKTVCKAWNAKIDRSFMHEAMVLGCELIFPEFLGGKLIFRPAMIGDMGKIELKISDLWNPLGGTFNLSQCSYTANYLSISTGYRKVQRPENRGKMEIWFAPRFLIEKELGAMAGYFKPLMDSWKQDHAPVGIFWTTNENNLYDYEYLTTENMERLSKTNLYGNYQKRLIILGGMFLQFLPWGRASCGDEEFQVSFVN